MRAFFTTIVMLIMLASTAVAQFNFDPSRLVYSGTINFAITNNFATATISPQVGYALNDIFTIGSGINYNYRRQMNANTSMHYLGLNAFGRATPIRHVALQVQPEGHYMWGRNIARTRFIPSVLVGAGIVIPSGIGTIHAMVFYDIVQYTRGGVNYSPYGNEVVYSITYVLNFATR